MTDAQIARNIAVHDRIARKYERRHDEIFNPREQARLGAVLADAKAAIASGRAPLKALDFGCGSGNLTGHLLRLGFHVTAADVSPAFLKLVDARHTGAPLSTHRLNGHDLRELDDGAFDLVATYSVLHHIPDYLAALREVARVTAPGGVVVVDHELNEEFWTGNPAFAQLQTEALRPDLSRFFRPANYYHKIRRLFDPRHTNEGDIHVWPDDHIEWPKIRGLLESLGFEVIRDEDYLLYRGRYRPEAYDRFVGRCTDTKVMIFRKCAG